MKTIEELLCNLARPEVLEFALASDRLPCVKVGGSFQPVDGAAPTTDAILQMLVGVGGSRYVESLSPKPTQWTTRLDTIGVITISAIMRNDVVQARFTLTKREVPAAQGRPIPPVVTKDTVTVTPTAQQPMSVAKSRRDASEPPPKPPRHDDDDEPTLMNQPPAAAPARPRLEVPLEIELEDTARPSPSPMQAAAPVQMARAHAASPSAPPPAGPLKLTPNEEEETTAQIEVQRSGGAQSIVMLHGGAPPGAPASAQPPGTAKSSPPASASPGEPKEALRTFQTQRMVVPPEVLKPAPSDAAHATPSAPPAPAPAPSAPPAGDGSGSEDPSVPSISISVMEQARIQTAPSRQPSTGMGLDELLGLARAAGATDLHVVSGRPALLRVGGELTARTTAIEPAVVEKIAREIVPARAAAALEMDGACELALEHGTHGRFRASVSRQRTGLKISLRVLPREVPTLASLGLPESLAAAVEHARGLVVVAGPAGHGKTSTVAALVDVVLRGAARHVVVVDDPIEIAHPRRSGLVSQREVGAHVRSVAAAVRAAVRDGADVVVLGDLGDAESARAALAASEAGRLVLATINASSAAKALARIVDAFPPGEQRQARASLAGELRMVVCQRLVPSADRARVHVAAEVLPTSVALYALVRAGEMAQIPQLLQRTRAQGTARLDDALAQLVAAGKVDLATARAFAEDPEALDKGDARAASTRAPAEVPMAQPTTTVRKRAPEEQAMDLGGLLSKAGSLFGGKKG